MAVHLYRRNPRKRKLILEYISESIENEKAGISLKPEKKTAIESELMNDALAKDRALAEAFESFTPSKQREFLEHIEGAKREETKLARLEKAKEMIVAKKGLYDKYKSARLSFCIYRIFHSFAWSQKNQKDLSGGGTRLKI